MSTTTITLNGNTVTVVALPSNKFRARELKVSNAIATVTSPYTGQTQTQSWPGGDLWSGMLTLPPLAQSDADTWIAFVLECRGMQNAFQLGDYLKRTPNGSVAGTPLIDNTGNGGNPAMSQNLATKGWTANAQRVLLPGDYIQVGYRLHMVLDTVNADSSGNAVLSIAPSLREQPTDGSALITSNCVGLFRLGTNQPTWSVDYTKHTRLSFPILEFR